MNGQELFTCSIRLNWRRENCVLWLSTCQTVLWFHLFKLCSLFQRFVQNVKFGIWSWVNPFFLNVSMWTLALYMKAMNLSPLSWPDESLLAASWSCVYHSTARKVPFLCRHMLVPVIKTGRMRLRITAWHTLLILRQNPLDWMCLEQFINCNLSRWKSIYS